jgi:hypothetical protein
VAFPFLPAGIILAVAVLGGAFFLFGVVLHAIDRTATEIKGSFLPGMVSGLRDWSRTHERHPVRQSSPPS